MNRQEAALVIKDRLNDEIWKQENGLEVFPVNMDAFRVAIKALRGPQPDPDTGLVPCGCGGVLELRARPIPWPETYQKGMVTNTKMQYWVFCRKCHWSTMDYLSKELAVQHANRAMGFRGEETP